MVITYLCSESVKTVSFMSCVRNSQIQRQPSGKGPGITKGRLVLGSDRPAF